MPEQPEQPEEDNRSTGRDRSDRDQQITALLEIVSKVAGDQRRLEGQLNRLAKLLRERDRKPEADNDEPDPNAPAPWVWFSPPAPDDPDEDAEEDPRVFVENFVAAYNTMFAGIEGGRAKPIPGCWEEHPGLAMEVASLAYSWRAANMGPAASIREAQYWLHQWRPGFTERLLHWVHADCLDGDHRAGGAGPRQNRFVVNQPPATATPTPPAGPPGWSPP